MEPEIKIIELSDKDVKTAMKKKRKKMNIMRKEIEDILKTN